MTFMLPPARNGRAILKERSVMVTLLRDYGAHSQFPLVSEDMIAEEVS